MSSVIRVVKNHNYTTLSNYHFKDKRLSWKAKGLLSTMLSLPDDWSYTIEGLASLANDGIKATNSGLAELEKYGYLVRKQLRDGNGHFVAMEYTIYEQSTKKEQDGLETEAEKSLPLCQNGQTDENTAFSPSCQKRQTEKRFAGKGVLLNTNILNTKELSTYSSSSSQHTSTEEEEQLRNRLKIDDIAARYSAELVEIIFAELSKRNPEFKKLMTARAVEQVCIAIIEKQRREPIRMLPNLINTYLDNIMLGIKAVGAGGGNSPPQLNMKGNPFNQFKQNQYDFEALEKELLGN